MARKVFIRRVSRWREETLSPVRPWFFGGELSATSGPERLATRSTRFPRGCSVSPELRFIHRPSQPNAALPVSSTGGLAKPLRTLMHAFRQNTSKLAKSRQAKSGTCPGYQQRARGAGLGVGAALRMTGECRRGRLQTMLGPAAERQAPFSRRHCQQAWQHRIRRP